jgi:hypothetical protein
MRELLACIVLIILCVVCLTSTEGKAAIAHAKKRNKLESMIIK